MLKRKPLIKGDLDLDLDDEEEAEESSTNQVLDNEVIINNSLYYTTRRGKTYSIYIVTEIKERSSYIDLLILLRSLKKSDKVNVYFNSGGGRVDTAVQIIHAIQESKAIITAVIDGCCYSMAPIMALSCDEVVVNPYASIMFHDTRGGVSDEKNGNVLGQQRHVVNHYENLLKDIIGKVLSDKEIENLFHGRDIYLTAKQFKERLNAKK